MTDRGSESGYDGGKQVKGRKRHILVDTLGLSIAVLARVLTNKIAMGPSRYWDF